MTFFAYAILTLIVSACQKEFEVDNSHAEAQRSGIVDLSFEVETLTLPTLQNAEDATTQEKIQSIAFSERSKVQVNIYEDGTSAWRMEKQKPIHDLTVHHQTPPNNRPKVLTTSIDRTGMGSFYDHNDSLLFKHKVPVSSFIEVVTNVKENPNVIFSVMGVKTADNVKLLLANAKAKGSIVSELGSNLVSVRSGNGKNAVANARQTNESDSLTTVDIFNTSLGILIGSTLYDQQEEIVCQAFYKYRLNMDNRLVPETIYMQSWDKDPVTGAKRKVETNIYFENVVATVNIN